MLHRINEVEHVMDVIVLHLKTSFEHLSSAHCILYTAFDTRKPDDTITTPAGHKSPEQCVNRWHGNSIQYVLLSRQA